MAGADNKIPSPALEPPVDSVREADASLCRDPSLRCSEPGRARSHRRRARSRSSRRCRRCSRYARRCLGSATNKDVLAMLEGMRSEQSTHGSSILRALEAIQDKQRTMIEGTLTHFDSIFHALADHLTVQMETRGNTKRLMEFADRSLEANTHWFRRFAARNVEIMNEVNHIGQTVDTFADLHGSRHR